MTDTLKDQLARIIAHKDEDDIPDRFDLQDVGRFVQRAIPQLNRWEDARYVELAYCCGSECLRANGKRLATWRGTGPCSIYIVCDDCHAQRLSDEERQHMVPILGADVARRLHLHDLSRGRSPEDVAPMLTPTEEARVLAESHTTIGPGFSDVARPQIEGCDVCGRTPTTSGSEDGEQRHVCAEHGPDTWTPARIAEALERCERAPEGPWGVFEQDCLCWITGPTRIIGDEGEMSRTVATFIAAARTGYPSALRALQAAQGEIERLTNANANHKALRAAAETAGRDVCNERDEARRDRDALALKVETMIEIETHARDLMRNANHHADADDRCNITVDSEPFNALHELFAPVFAAERKATRAAKKASR